MYKDLSAFINKTTDINTLLTFTLQRPVYEPDNGATSWYANIGLGTPPQTNLRFMIDTGTKNTWITSNLCNSSACAPHRKFDPAVSGSFKKMGARRPLILGPGDP